jgi:hypothetical protein
VKLGVAQLPKHHGMREYVTFGNPKHPKSLTLGDETPAYGPRRGKLVHQFPGVVTLAYYLCLTHMIHR